MPDIDYDLINWEDSPSTSTPIARRNLDKMDRAIYDVANYLKKTNTYILESSSWVSSGNSIYPYKLVIQSDKYTNDDSPICQAWGMNDIETQDELTSINYIKKVIVDLSGVTVYASSKPTVNLKLVVKL